MKHTINVAFLPPTMNEIVAMNRHQYARTKNDYGRYCAIAAFDAPRFAGKVWIALDWRIKNMNRDPDNTSAALKFIFDALVNCEIIKDDSCRIIQPPLIHNWLESKDEGVGVTISDSPIYTLTKNV